jgi:hypothetical protein
MAEKLKAIQKQLAETLNGLKTPPPTPRQDKPKLPADIDGVGYTEADLMFLRKQYKLVPVKGDQQSKDSKEKPKKE